jgi:hypothetical protein
MNSRPSRSRIGLDVGYHLIAIVPSHENFADIVLADGGTLQLKPAMHQRRLHGSFMIGVLTVLLSLAKASADAQAEGAQRYAGARDCGGGAPVPHMSILVCSSALRDQNFDPVGHVPGGDRAGSRLIAEEAGFAILSWSARPPAKLSERYQRSTTNPVTCFVIRRGFPRRPVYFLLSQDAREGVHPLACLAWGLAGAAVILVPLARPWQLPWHVLAGGLSLGGRALPAPFVLFWLILVATAAAYATSIAALRRLTAAVGATVASLEVIASVAIAWVLLGETLRPVQLLGGGFVLSGAVLAQRTVARRDIAAWAERATETPRRDTDAAAGKAHAGAT